MAKRKHSNPTLDRDEMLHHMDTLGFKGGPEYYTVAQYRQWCERHQFEFGVDPYSLEGKSRNAAQKEIAYHQQLAQSAKALERLYKNPDRLIRAACQKTIDPRHIQQPDIQELCRMIIRHSKPECAAELEAFLLHIHKRSSFLFEQDQFAHGRSYYLTAVLHLFDRRKQWLRDIESWKPKSHNRHKQFIALTEHLMAQYNMPAFMATVWLRNDRGSYKYRNWYIHMGRGKNIRNVTLPIPLSKKMAHYFCLAPPDASFEHALRWGQIHALGGDDRLCNAIAGSRLGNSFENDEFWQTVLRFFIDNPLLDRSHIAPLIDYIYAQKYAREEVIVGPGQVEIQAPPQPNLSMRGRSPDTLLRQMEQWHHGLHKRKSGKNLFFKRCGIKEFALKTGNKKDPTTWTIRELLSSAELYAEGKAMRHCVGSYASSCANGNCSIWALESKTDNTVRKHQTIEVNKHRVIVQSRGKQNRLPDDQEKQVINKWAQAAQLQVSKYIDDYW